MKKLILFALIISAVAFSSCKKEETKYYYYYTTSRHLVDVTGMPENNISQLDTYLVENKFGKVFEFTTKEAQEEWQSFVNATSEMEIFVNEDSYFQVSFDRYEKQEGQNMVAVENIGKLRWGEGQ